jgi:hypothetical protein
MEGGGGKWEGREGRGKEGEGSGRGKGKWLTIKFSYRGPVFLESAPSIRSL